MKVLQVITSLNVGGAEALVTAISIALRRRGIAVDVAVFNDSETPLKARLLAAGCRVFPFGHSFYNPQYIFKLAKLMRGYDIVHTHNTSPQYFAAIASMVSPSRLVTTEHNTANRRRKRAWYAAIDRLVYNRYAQIICISNKAEDNLRAWLGRCKAGIQTIHNGIDVAAFRGARPAAGMKTARFVVVMVAGFRHEKDQDTVIRAIARLPEDKFELWLVGDGVRRAEIEALVEKLGVRSQVKFLGVRNDVPALLHAADAIVMSSHYEGLSLSNIEGMAVGKPFVASDVDGLHEATVGAGILFPHEDDGALAKILLHLQQEPAYAAEVADTCYRRALQYDITTTTDAYAAVYDTLMYV